MNLIPVSYQLFPGGGGLSGLDNTPSTPILLSSRTITKYKQNKLEKIVDGGGGEGGGGGGGGKKRKAEGMGIW